MGNRPAAYWIALLVALAAVAGAFILRRSPDPHMHDIAQYLGWGAIALLVVARFGLRPKTPPTPPMPKD